MTPAELQILISRLTGVAEEMGAVLRRAAFSPNIKERADCSAALFTADGELLVQAEHIPVHLGSMPASVADEMGAVLRRAAYSPNIKERADCSAALFTADGELLVQAEHIPVHLGSMPASVRAAIDVVGDPGPLGALLLTRVAPS